MNLNLSGNYVMNQTIDCSGFSFIPVGNLSSPFNGTLDGQGNSIANLTISSTGNNTGLFGNGNGATVKNIVIKNVNVYANKTSSNYVGSLLGYCTSCTITNITLRTTSASLSNNVSGDNFLGGICGQMNGGIISNCSVENTFVSGSANVAGILGYGVSVYISNCFNLGFRNNPSQMTIRGAQYVGGLIGYCNLCNITQSGVESGLISSSSSTGAIVGYSQNCPLVSQVYSSQNVIISSGSYSGGLIGEFKLTSSSFSFYSVSNVYSKANVTSSGNYVGGLFGQITFIGANGISLNFSNSFSSCFVNGVSQIGNIIGRILNSSSQYTLTFSQVYFNNQTNPLFPLSGIGNGSSTDGSSPQGFPCSQLWNQINSTFDQTNIWSGDKLKIENEYRNCSCSSGCSLSASTQIPSTLSLPSLNPSTQIIQQTNIPSSQQTTSSPFSCFYQVPNCQNCSPNPPVVDLNQLNVSCSFIQNQFVWIFTNKTSNTITNNVTITLNGTTTFIQGNFSQTSNGNLVVVISANNNKSSSLNVAGCVEVNGTISLNLQTQPQQGNSTFQIISYSCSQTSNISSSQIQVTPNYKNSNCDQINSQAINNPNSISVSISSSLGSKCGGVPLGLIIALGVVLPVIAIATVCVVLYLVKRRNHQKAVKAVKEFDMQQITR